MTADTPVNDASASPPIGVRAATLLRRSARRSGLHALARRTGVNRLVEQAMLRRYADPSSRIDLEVGGFNLRVPGPSLEMYLFDRYEPLSIEWLEHTVGAGWLAVDAGASVGYLSLHLSRLVGPSGRVIACEPVSETAEILSRNIQRNGVDNITVVNAAVGSAIGHRTLQLTRSGYLDGFYGNPRTRTVEERAVPTVTVDALSDERVDFVKIDVEGAELEVLDGMQATLKTVRAVMVEWNPACLITAGADPRNLPARLIDAEFDVQVLDEDAGCVRSVSSVLADLDSGRLGPFWYGNLVARR